jgi:pre-mRNA cleavage complex 2 protein Pcf11
LLTDDDDVRAPTPTTNNLILHLHLHLQQLITINSIMSKSNDIKMNIKVEDDEEEIDEEQVEDYCSMLDRLGNFPEKVAINSLSMAAEDFATSPTSAQTIYNCIRSRLIDRATPGISSPDRKLPLVYVLDSLLKNVKGVYIDIIQDDAATWMSTVYDMFDKANKENEKARLKKVWNTWREFGVIQDEEKWRQIGECFIKADEKAKAVADARANPVAGIGRNADGTLQITPTLRKQMQLLLDEVQSTGVDELDKVSLERLADINPDLLQQLKEAAIEDQKQQQLQQLPSSTIPTSNAPIFVAPPLSDWSKLNLNHLEKSHDLIASLQRHIRSANEMTVVKSQLDDTIHLFASVSASAQLLTDMLQKLQDGNGFGFLPGHGNTSSSSSGGGGGSTSTTSRRRKRYSLVKKENFTNEGIRKHNDAVIAQLYEVGLPFVCSADGRRFASQLELSKHLDGLFRKSQLEKKSMINTTEERGWYIVESVWVQLGRSDVDAATLVSTEKQMLSDPTGTATTADASTSNENNRAILSTVIADESRDRCLLCGINFAMYFDQEDGEWKYKNCIERSVEQDGPTMDDEEELESVLVHMTCWEGLGSPECLTPDQIRHVS